MFNIGNLNLNCDFETRVIREDELDADIFIDIKNRPLDIGLGENDFGITSRIQFSLVRGILLRISKQSYNMTVHLLANIDLHSAYANFEIEYKDSVLNIKEIDGVVCIYKK
jgi:hypothetical protein